MVQNYAYVQAKLEASGCIEESFHPGTGRYLLGDWIRRMAINVRKERRFQKVFCENNNNKGRKT